MYEEAFAQAEAKRKAIEAAALYRSTLEGGDFARATMLEFYAAAALPEVVKSFYGERIEEIARRAWDVAEAMVAEGNRRFKAIQEKIDRKE